MHKALFNVQDIIVTAQVADCLKVYRKISSFYSAIRLFAESISTAKLVTTSSHTHLTSSMMQLMSGSSSQASSLFPGSGAAPSWPSFSPYSTATAFSAHPPSPTSTNLTLTSSSPMTSHCTAPLYVPTTHASQSMLQPPPVGSALNPAGALPAATPAPSSAGSALTTYDHAAYSSSLASSAAYPGALPLPPAAADLRSGAGLGLGYSSTDRSYMMPAFNKGYYGNYGENLSSLTSPPGFVPRQG